MKKSLLVLLLAAAPLAACAGDYYGPVGPGPVGYDGFYDDYYGPIYDGYWGGGGIGGGDVFYYRRHNNGRFIADRGGHFRHDAGPGPGGPGGGFGGHGGHGHGGGAFHPMHGSMTPPAGGHGHGGGHGHH